MKGKLAASLLSLLMLFNIAFGTSHADVIWMDGGLIGDPQISGTNEYQELCFITGEPVLLKGSVKLPVVPTDKDTYSLKYTFELTNVAKGITLERGVTFDVTKVTNANITQTKYEKKLTKYTETITTTGGVYTLGKYTFSDSRLEDNTPAVDYFSGLNSTTTRTYYINGDYMTNEGYVTYNIDYDTIVGYKHLYGNNETVVVKQEIRNYKPNPSYDPKVYNSQEYNIWTGTVDIGMSSSENVRFEYQYTDPQSISFRGSYFKVTSVSNVLTYKYSLPIVTSGVVDLKSTKRNTGEVNLSETYEPSTTTLVSPKIRDIGGHWAEDEIFLLTSMEVFDVEKEYFVPTATISRLDFGKAMVVAINGVLPEPTTTEVIKRLRPGVDTLYLDIKPEDPDYHYIQFIKENDIMAGKNGYFKPAERLTRQEAITIMIKVLGLQYMAPAPPYKTGFVDDASIGEWAKDSVYMANEIGLVTGTPEGNVLPNKLVSKAEAATMFNSFINHLKDKITYDYREKILNR